MKILVTGVKGQLGYDVVKVLQFRHSSYLGADMNDFDITNTEATNQFIETHRPDGVIHCAAYTAVDKAEEQAELCGAVNILGTKNIALACKKINAKMLYISTDYVFPGVGEKAYEVNDPTSPLSVYGKMKLGGENVVKEFLTKYFIVRISWAFGENGNNFIKTMLRLGQELNEVNVVCDQVGSPTYTADLAPLLCDMIATEKYGIYHATNEGYCTWAELAEKAFEVAGMDVRVNHIATSEYPTRATRPFNSRMSKSSLDAAGFQRLPEWKDALKRYLTEARN